jgi:hypothetical protein
MMALSKEVEQQTKEISNSQESSYKKSFNTDEGILQSDSSKAGKSGIY